MKLNRNFVALLLCSAFATSGCSYFSQSSRQQRAYQRYVRKSAGVRQRQKLKYAKSSFKVAPQKASQPKVSAQAEEAPQSMTSSSSQENQ